MKELLICSSNQSFCSIDLIKYIYEPFSVRHYYAQYHEKLAIQLNMLGGILRVTGHRNPRTKIGLLSVTHMTKNFVNVISRAMTKACPIG